MWVLIIAALGNVTTGSASMLSIQFETRELCEAAKVQTGQLMTDKWSVPVKAVCVETQANRKS